jgi:uncharacterized protein (DUF1778 family)
MRRARIDLRVRPEEKQAWFDAADAQGLDLSEWIRREMNKKVARPKRSVSTDRGMLTA